MKRIMLFLWAFLSISVLALANSGEDALSAEEKQVMQAIHGRLDASAQSNTSSWAKFVSDEMITPLEGQMKSKEAWIHQHESWPPELKYWYGPLEDVKIRILGDTAVVIYHAKQFTEIGGQTTFIHKWQIETHMRKGKDWLLVGVADGLIPPEPVAANVDPKIYDAYVGQYEWAPKLISTITREGNNLFEEFINMGKSELPPENETTFFIRGEAASGNSSRLIFVKNSAGQVTHYIYREMGATDRIVKKIK